MKANTPPKIMLVSRCAWTLHNFRRNLAKQAQRLGDVTLVGAEFDQYGDRLREAGLNYQPIDVPMKGIAPVGDLKLLWNFFRTFRREKPQIVHCFTIKPVVYGTLAAAAAGVPRRICTITGLGHAFGRPGSLVNLVARALYSVALAFAHDVFFQNEDDRRMFVNLRLVNPAKAKLVPGSGVDLEHFSQQPFEPTPGKRPTRFLMMARLLVDKGVLDFIEAAALLKAQGVDAEFWLMGAEEPRNPLALNAEQLERLRASDVKYLGSAEDVRPAIAAADVAVLPSYREGTSRFLLEAMAIGRPIITSDVAGCRQLVSRQMHGRMIPPRDPEALAAAMKQMNDAAVEGQLPELGRVARHFVQAHYDELIVIETTLAIYRRYMATTQNG